MLQSLQNRWKVSGIKLFLILTTFAVTGTVTAWVSKMICLRLEAAIWSVKWWVLKLTILVIGYQILILFFGGLFGQFAFFWNYEKKLLRRAGILPKNPKKIRLAIFSSGMGSNYQAINSHFSKNPTIEVALVVCNKQGAGVVGLAKNNKTEVFIIDKNNILNGSGLSRELKKRKIDYIILAGFLWKIPNELIAAYPRRIINIHPALLPKFGGMGMYGENVHKAVLEEKEKESGITIHFVDDHYDHGDIIFQKRCDVDPNDTPETLANKIHLLEHDCFAVEIEKLIKTQNPS